MRVKHIGKETYIIDEVPMRKASYLLPNKVTSMWNNSRTWLRFLSGGQKSRLAFAELAWLGCPVAPQMAFLLSCFCSSGFLLWKKLGSFYAVLLQNIIYNKSLKNTEPRESTTSCNSNQPFTVDLYTPTF